MAAAIKKPGLRDVSPIKPVSEETLMYQDLICDWIRRNITDETRAYAVIAVEGTEQHATVSYKSDASPRTISRDALAYFAYQNIKGRDEPIDAVSLHQIEIAP